MIFARNSSNACTKQWSLACDEAMKGGQMRITAPFLHSLGVVSESRETEAGGKGKGGVEGKTAGMDGICEWNYGPGKVDIGHDLIAG